jgi:hypothetical protein
LTKHVERIHLESSRVACDQCQKTFSKKSSLNRHVKTVHSRTKVNKCCLSMTNTNGRNIVRPNCMYASRPKCSDAVVCSNFFSHTLLYSIVWLRFMNITFKKTCRRMVS